MNILYNLLTFLLSAISYYRIQMSALLLRNGKCIEQPHREVIIYYLITGRKMYPIRISHVNLSWFWKHMALVNVSLRVVYTEPVKMAFKEILLKTCYSAFMSHMYVEM